MKSSIINRKPLCFLVLFNFLVCAWTTLRMYMHVLKDNLIIFLVFHFCYLWWAICYSCKWSSILICWIPRQNWHLLLGLLYIILISLDLWSSYGLIVGNDHNVKQKISKWHIDNHYYERRCSECNCLHINLHMKLLWNGILCVCVLSVHPG